MRSHLLFVLLLALPLCPAEAQWKEPPFSTARLAPGLSPVHQLPESVTRSTLPESLWSKMLPPATLGSLVGLPVGAAAGGFFYEATGCCFEGGDDPGLSEVALGAALGSTLGSALGAYMVGTRDQPVSFGRALLGSALGFLPAAYLGVRAGEETSTFIGFGVYGLTHAAITAAVAASTPQRASP